VNKDERKNEENEGNERNDAVWTGDSPGRVQKPLREWRIENGELRMNDER
jgi:hypothetical protein